ncbi:AAA family ATPase [Comamonadaceae bacterium M7527]|nr:AAA family ATPase [Comamonadaceae bacterium M7527]UFS56108.1 AAA family ATPase [Comamonadaceae bacterium M7527]
MNKFEYTPTTIDEIVFGNDESRELIEDIVSGSLPFPYEGKSGILLYGTFGSGKTTLARLLPSAIEFGKTQDTLAMEAEFFGCQQGHTNTTIMESVKKMMNVQSLNASGLHYLIFDEVDNLSKLAQGSMKTVLNNKRAVFILTTNNIAALDKGLKDRCVLIEMNAAADAEFLPIARRMASDAEVVLNDSQLLAAISGNNGSFRNVMFSLQRLMLKVQRGNAAARAALNSIKQAASK